MYLDTMSGSAGPAMVGHANPRVAEAVARQMATLPTTSILHQSDTLIAYCTRLAGLTPEGLTKVAVLAGGGEAIEAAIKLAMRVTGRTEVLSLHGAYHGMSLATMGLAGIVGDRAWLPGAVRWPTFRQVPNADTYRNPLRALAGGSAVIGDIRGPGLFVGIDYVLDAGTREPATAACADAWQYAARRGLLCQFGGIGGNVLKFKPPLTTPDEDFEHMLGLVEDVTRFIEERVTGRVAAGV
jgi:4-aminobutyrate aminotransferase-like enzyme